MARFIVRSWACRVPALLLVMLSHGVFPRVSFDRVRERHALGEKRFLRMVDGLEGELVFLLPALEEHHSFSRMAARSHRMHQSSVAVSPRFGLGSFGALFHS